MYWLAINHEPISLSDLEKDILSLTAKEQVPSTLQSLDSVLPLERSLSRFRLQPVILEYTTKRLVEQMVKEIRDRRIDLFHTHALLKASAKDYVRDTQSRLILKPVINGLLETWGSQARLEAELKRIVSMLRETHPHIPSYATGNILNLLLQLQTSLRGYDFSGLVVNQAYLSEVAL